jgi:hypothetical protein
VLKDESNVLRKHAERVWMPRASGYHDDIGPAPSLGIASVDLVAGCATTKAIFLEKLILRDPLKHDTTAIQTSIMAQERGVSVKKISEIDAGDPVSLKGIWVANWFTFALRVL